MKHRLIIAAQEAAGIARKHRAILTDDDVDELSKKPPLTWLDASNQSRHFQPAYESKNLITLGHVAQLDRAAEF